MRPTFSSMGFTPEEAMDSLLEDVALACQELAKERARAERYLAAIVEWIEIEDIDRQPRAHKDKTDDEYSAFLLAQETRRINAMMAIRAIVEEARHEAKQ